MPRNFLHRVAVLALLLLSGRAEAQDPVLAATQAYEQREFEAALLHLTNLDGLLEVAPVFDRVKGEDRQRVLFDLARCRFAMGDSVGARVVLGELFRNDPRQSRGRMDLEKDDAYRTVVDALSALRRNQRQARINETSALKAGLRSLVVPGWGQVYRGRKQRGRAITIGTGALAVGWFFADRAYNSALDAYRRTSELDLNLPGRTGGPDDPNPFEERFKTVESRASTARTMAIALVSLWSYSVLENFVLQPGRVTLTVPLD